MLENLRFILTCYKIEFDATQCIILIPTFLLYHVKYIFKIWFGKNIQNWNSSRIRKQIINQEKSR